MKKFLALLLAAMMLLSCATAMADVDHTAAYDSITNDNPTWLTSGEDADIEVYDNIRYSDTAKFDKEGKMATELWMQVDATGQIDVELPLVLVFQTNIDGGDATSPETYQITNHSTADLAVTAVKVTDIDNTSGSSPKMTLDTYENVAKEDTLVDRYGVRITPADFTDTYGNVRNVVENTEDPNNPNALVLDMKTINEMPGNTQTANASEGGVFMIQRAKNAQTAETTRLTTEMVTTPLTFVTKRDNPDAADAMDKDDLGVHLMTVTYTVAINTNGARGEEILGATTVVDDLNAPGSKFENTIDNTTLKSIEDSSTGG